jgi:hypothetical protein
MKTAESHNADLTGRITFVEMPVIPEEAWKWIEEVQKQNEAASAKNELLTHVRVEGTETSA